MKDKILAKKKLVAALISVAVAAVILCVVGRNAFEISSDNSSANAETTTTYLMGTVVTITTYGDTDGAASRSINSIIENLEDQVISWRVEGSQVYNLNNNEKLGERKSISADLARYILTAMEVSNAGNGLLDITIRPLADLWGIEDGKEEVPSATDIAMTLRNVNYGMMFITSEAGEILSSAADVKDDDQYYIDFAVEEITIDLGSIGKGAACDKALEYLADSDLSGATVSVGGSILCYGTKGSGKTFSIGIRNPRSDEDTAVMGVVEVDSSETSYVISTSGDYEKYFELDGVRYHHILDPTTGYPASTGTISATAICENGALSDALSTICVLLEKDEALAMAETFEAVIILIDEDKNVYIAGENDDISFSITNKEYSLND